MFQFRHAAAAILVIAGSGTAGAQTVITQPAETIITRPPLQLTPAQRTTVYRTIIPRSRGRRPIVHERVVTESVRPTVREQVVVPETVAPTVGERVVVPAPTYVAPADDYVEAPAYVPAPPAYVPAPRETYTYEVGTRVPTSVRLAPLPRTVLAREPNLEPYRYMVFRDRVLLVDPVTSTIVADVTQ
jgi:hypothetical protein